MIEINLSPSKKAGGVTNIGGVDLSLINVKMMVIALIFMFVPEMVLQDMWESEKSELNIAYMKLNKEYKSYGKKVRSLGNIEKQVEALRDQEQKLAKKLLTVKEIINKRQNPFKVLHYLANNIPEEVWVIELNLDDKDLEIIGYSRSWKSIGGFLENLKNSIFFARGIEYSKPVLPNIDEKLKRYEPFSIKAKIQSFK